MHVSWPGPRERRASLVLVHKAPHELLSPGVEPSAHHLWGNEGFN